MPSIELPFFPIVSYPNLLRDKIDSVHYQCPEVHAKRDQVEPYFLFISIDYLSPRLIPSSQIPVAFCTDLPFFPPKSIPSFFPIELFRDLRLPREIDTDVSPPGSLLKLRSLSLSFFLSFPPPLFSRCLNIFHLFLSSLLPRTLLVEAGGSISTRFQNSFISRSATRITDNVDDAQTYRDPWKINPV